MAEIGLMANLWQKQKDFYTTLSFSAVLLTVGNPFVIFDIGFQLSYGATFSLIYLAPLLSAVFQKYLPEKLATVLAVSCAPICFTTPLSLYYFNGFSLIGLPINILIAPWVESLVLFGFVAALVGLISLPLAAILNLFNNSLLNLLQVLVNVGNSIPWAYQYYPQISWVMLCAMLAWLFLAIEYWRTKKPVLKNIWFGLSLIIIVGMLLSRTNCLEINLFDVGQGEAIMICTPQKQTLLIDAGSVTIRGVGEQVIWPALIKRGIRRIDYLILTHAHADHYNGLPELIPKIPIGTAFVPARSTESDYQLLEQELGRKARDMRSAEFMEMLALAGIQISFLYPLVPTDGGNDDSYVILLEYKGFKMLFTGDLEHRGEQEILARGLAEDIDVLKVAHHGSKTSSSRQWLEAWTPEYALISVGAENTYGHPAPQVIAELEAQGIKVYRTDYNGAISLKISGAKQYQLSSYVTR